MLRCRSKSPLTELNHMGHARRLVPKARPGLAVQLVPLQPDCHVDAALGFGCPRAQAAVGSRAQVSQRKKAYYAKHPKEGRCNAESITVANTYMRTATPGVQVRVHPALDPENEVTQEVSH